VRDAQRETPRERPREGFPTRQEEVDGVLRGEMEERESARDVSAQRRPAGPTVKASSPLWRATTATTATTACARGDEAPRAERNRRRRGVYPLLGASGREKAGER
jgi:hypothetical protein